MVVRFLQANLNHACQAQHLFLQSLAERGVGLALVAEPYRVPEDNPTWIGDNGGSAAIVRVAAASSPPLRVIERGVGYAAGSWGSFSIIACYAPPPSWDLGAFDALLEWG